MGSPSFPATTASTPVAAKRSPAMATLAGTTIAGLCSLGAALPAKAAVVANYEFQNTLSSTIPTAPDLVPFVLGSNAPVIIGSTPPPSTTSANSRACRWTPRA
jgi:hypothetical protein